MKQVEKTRGTIRYYLRYEILELGKCTQNELKSILNEILEDLQTNTFYL